MMNRGGGGAGAQGQKGKPDFIIIIWVELECVCANAYYNNNINRVHEVCDGNHKQYMIYERK